jgi:hypothetical protein
MILNLPTEKTGKRPSAGGGGQGAGGRGRGSGKGPRPDTLGVALHSVYDATLAEDIPPEMLDLLGKLG